ncbi:hypothetical protein NH26_14420 [Flammeovirga pacifica]|uniref:Uncharacterized protein n=2 Tax=Flammeovirga pacifica TaxID=915059 RepID=A0A1S1Z2R4_FLAPC|nr:hypothetical protein NH26_14420 [Flammeovirga pacifica]
MEEVVETFWKNELKKDFPEHEKTLNHLFETLDHILDLARDYYLCKHQIRILERREKEELCNQYQETLDELHNELSYFIKKYSNQINYKSK